MKNLIAIAILMLGGIFTSNVFGQLMPTTAGVKSQRKVPAAKVKPNSGKSAQTQRRPNPIGIWGMETSFGNVVGKTTNQKTQNQNWSDATGHFDLVKSKSKSVTVPKMDGSSKENARSKRRKH
ncbi:MAG: hypothetical protein K1X72_05965 [Pyrinomonadaceae bacterium]|nr:hypothetical protein [Pyrinomonadaceae bacterium]